MWTHLQDAEKEDGGGGQQQEAPGVDPSVHHAPVHYPIQGGRKQGEDEGGTHPLQGPLDLQLLAVSPTCKLSELMYSHRL